MSIKIVTPALVEAPAASWPSDDIWLLESTCQSANQLPTSWSDMMWLWSQRTSQATYIISNQHISWEAHVTLRRKPHTDMLTWIPNIPWPLSGTQQQVSKSTYRSTQDSNVSPPTLSVGAWRILRVIYRGTIGTPGTSCPPDSMGPVCAPLPAARLRN